jgi:hypothetical protein
MKTDLRQGIVKAQTSPSFIYKSAGGFGLDTSNSPIVISFINGESETLFIEDKNVENAWKGPFPRNSDHWLYWDLDQNGKRTFGKTNVEPYKYSGKEKPKFDQHYFDYSTNQIKVWNGRAWEVKLRVFAAKVVSSSSFKPYGLGSQIANNTQRDSGGLIYNADFSIIKSNTIFETTSPISTQTNFITEDYFGLIEKQQIATRAKETLFKFAAFSIVTNDFYTRLSSYKSQPCFGLCLEPVLAENRFSYIRHGVVEDFYFDQFNGKAGDRLFLGEGGLLTKNARTDGSFVQVIGEFISPEKFFVNIQPPIYL